MVENPLVPLLAALALVIAAAKVSGWLSSRLGQPAVLGELLVGILLGPSVLNLFGQPYFDESHVADTLHEIGELGVIFLMFAAGLEIHLSDLKHTGRAAIFVGFLGVLVPFITGGLTLMLFGYSPDKAYFTGIVLGATSVSISAQTLMELGLLRSREGLTLLGAAVVDDVLAIALLSAFVAIAADGDTNVGGLLTIFGQMILFLAIALVAGLWLLPRLVQWGRKLPISQPVLSLVVIALLTFAWASEALGGVAAITGAFIAGVALSNSSLKDEIERGMRTLINAFFVPIFLVSIGLAANARALTGNLIVLTLILCLVAIVTKLIGGAAGAKLGGMSWPEARRVGAGMISRGEVGLIIAGVGTSQGIIETEVFTMIVVMILATTVAAPPLLRLSFRGQEVANG
jgi:Kef-type K+ transport system membrane component KefB